MSYSKDTRLPALAILVACTFATRAHAAAPIDFNRQIRPILSNKCLHCHGPDAKERAADLQLDDRDSALAENGSGFTIVPGKPDESVLIERINSDDPDERMPPTGSGHKLTEEEKKVLAEWIKQGAQYAKHWSYVKPVRPAIPKVKLAAWPKNDVDRFVLAKLESKGLKPSPEADRRTIIRRVSLDLTGLPPTLEEVEQFVNDKSSNAYEKLVDRLLAKPAYGEH